MAGNLAYFVDPRKINKSGEKININIMDIFKKILYKQLDRDYINIKDNKIELNLNKDKKIIFSIDNDIINIEFIKINENNYKINKGNDIIKILDELKQINKKLNNIEEINKKYRYINFLFDTCYDENKAKRLVEALGGIEGRLCGSGSGGCELFGKFLLLLASVYAEMVVSSDYYERAEWFPLLVRAAAGKGYLPVCLSKGDVAALVYYYVTRYGTGGVEVSADDVSKIVLGLAGLPR